MTTNRIYGVFDAQGAPQGFFVDDVYPPKEDGTRNDAIPAAATEITETEWQALLSGQPFTRYVNGEVVVDEMPPPPPPPPLPEALVEAQRANARLDAGVVAAADVAAAVRDAMQAIPDNFTATNFAAMKIQLDALTQAFAEMLQAQASAAT